jgi:hypothetical protein
MQTGIVYLQKIIGGCMYKLFIAALLLFSLGSCINSGTITDVTLSANPTSVVIGGSSVLSAVITGTGVYSKNLTWSIVSGGGTLKLDGSGTTFLAPNESNTTVIQAVSVQDPSKFGTVSVKTTPAK